MTVSACLRPARLALRVSWRLGPPPAAAAG